MQGVFRWLFPARSAFAALRRMASCTSLRLRPFSGSRAKPASLCDVVAAKRRKESYDNFLEEVLMGERDAWRARETQMPATDVLCPGG